MNWNSFFFYFPIAVVKQRLQMYNSPFRSMTECAIKVYRAEGIAAFYRSYGTQLAMNVPFQCVHFIVYEAMQNATNPERTYNPMGHVISGGVSGALAAAFTTPLDVCKTLLNTQVNTSGIFLQILKGIIALIHLFY